MYKLPASTAQLPLLLPAIAASEEDGAGAGFGNEIEERMVGVEDDGHLRGHGGGFFHVRPHGTQRRPV